MHILDTKLLFFVVPLFTSFVFGDGLKIDVACDSNRVSFLFENQSDKVLCVHTPSTVDVSYDDFTSSVYFIPDCKSETYERTSPYSVTCIPSKDKKNIETTLDILENCNAFCNKMIDMFVQKLSIKANKAGYGFNKKGESENRIEISNGRWKYVIDKYSTSGYWRGIETDNENNLISKTDHFFGENTKCDNSKYPLGWNYFKGNLCNWSNLSTIREMLNGSFADDIIKEVQSAFKKMDELHK